MENSRFIGIKAYSSYEKHIFFGRENSAERLFQNLLIEDTALIAGKTGTGKSSLLQAGLIPLLENSGRFEVLSIQLSANNKKLHTQLKDLCEQRFNQFSYLDKLIGRQDHIWYYLKKIQAQSSKIIVLLIDNFDALNKTEEQRFHDELAYALKAEIPIPYAEIIREKMPELSAKGKELLNTQTDIKMIWSVRPESENRLNSFATRYRFNPKNNLTIKAFKPEKAKTILQKIAGFTSGYKEENNFISKPFSFEDELLNQMFSQIESDLIMPADIQIIGRYAETVSVKEKISAITNDTDISAEKAANFFCYKNILPKTEHQQSYTDFLYYIAKAPENSSIPIKMLPDGFVKTFSEITDMFCDEETQSCHFLFKSAFIKQSIWEFLQSEKEKDRQITHQQKITRPPTTKLKFKRVLRYYQAAAFFLVLLAGFGLFSINKARKTAQDNKQLAMSNMYAAYSYKNAESDPTLSFRYAQKAYEHYPDNHEAYSALLNAYYSTEVFYSKSGTLPAGRREAVLSPDGKYVLASMEARHDTSAKAALYTTGGEEIKQFTNADPIYFTGFSANSNEAVFADTKGLLFLYNITADKLQSIKAADSRILHTEIARDGSLLILSEDGLSLLNARGETISDFQVYEFPYDMACISKDGSQIAAGAGNYIYLFTKEGDLLNDFELPTGAGIKYPRLTAVSFSPQNDKILAVVNDMLTKTGQVIVSDTEGNTLFKFGGHDDWIRTADFSPDGTHIVTASYDKTAAVLDENGTMTGRLKGHKSLVSDAVFFENNETVISVSDDAGIFSWKFGRLINPLAEIKQIDQAVFSPSELKILTAADTVLQIQNIFGKPEVIFDTEGKKIRLTGFTKDRKYIYALNEEGALYFWNSKGKLEQRLKGKKTRKNYIDFYSDSAFVMSPDGDSSLIIRNINTQQTVLKLQAESEINYGCFRHSDGHILTAEASGKIRLRDISGKIIKSYEGHADQVKMACFSPNEKLILSISDDKTAKLWTAKGQLLHTFPTYNARINSAVFSPDGEYIMTASDDNKIRLYTTSGQFTGMISYPGKAKQAVFSPDGDYIITLYSTYGKNTAKLQHISPEIILRYVNDDKVFGDIQEFDLE